MNFIRTIHFSGTTREELLPDFEPDFPYRFLVSDPSVFPDGQVPWHWHSAFELFYVRSGTLLYETPAGCFSFPAGSGGILDSGVLHSARTLHGEPALQLIHLFEPIFLEGSVGSRIGQKYLLPFLTDPALELLSLTPETPQHAAILQKLDASFALQPDAFGYELRLRSALSDLWLDLLTLPRPEQNARRVPDGACKAMMVYLHEHFAEPLRVEQIAAAGCCSEREAYRTFRECLHTTPLGYLLDLRLHSACARLADSRDSITAIAADCGFSSLSYFGKVFHRAFGCTPAAYRARWQDPTNFGR